MSRLELDTRYRLTGNTFTHRALLGSLGATWDKERKAWTLHTSLDTAELARQRKALHGIVADITIQPLKAFEP